MTGNPFTYPWDQISGFPFPGMLPIAPLGPQVLLPLATFNDLQVFWAGADFGRLLQAMGQTISTTFNVVAYDSTGTDLQANSRWTGAAAVVNSLAPPYGTGQVLGSVRRQFGPGVAGSVYGFVATCTLPDGTVLSQSSQGACVASEAGVETVISSGTYNSGTGLVMLTLASALDLDPGDTVTVSGATGTGSCSSINGTWTAGAGTAGSTVTYTIATGLAMTITGGNLSF